MTKFEPGDRVRVVQVTNEGQEPITDPADPRSFDWHGNPLIGEEGVVTDVFADDHARNNVRFGHLEQLVAFPDADLDHDE